MEFLQDISNTASSGHSQTGATTKTFARRRKAVTSSSDETTAGGQEPCTPASQAGSTTPLSTCSSVATPDVSTRRSAVSSAIPTCWSSVPHRGRRSSVLHAAALPGHQLCREAPASRSLLLQRMSKARQKAFLAYTQQMAKYYAEVDAFELTEESPGPASHQQARTRTRLQHALESVVETPKAPLSPKQLSIAAVSTGTMQQLAAQAQCSSSLSNLLCQSPQLLNGSASSFGPLLASAEKDEQENDEQQEQKQVQPISNPNESTAGAAAAAVATASTLAGSPPQLQSRDSMSSNSMASDKLLHAPTPSTAPQAHAPASSQPQQQLDLVATTSTASGYGSSSKKGSHSLAAETPAMLFDSTPYTVQLDPAKDLHLFAQHVNVTGMHVAVTPVDLLLSATPQVQLPEALEGSLLSQTHMRVHQQDLQASPADTAHENTAQQLAGQLCIVGGTSNKQQQQEEELQQMDKQVQQLQQQLQQLELVALTPEAEIQQRKNGKKQGVKVQPHERKQSARQQQRKQEQQQQELLQEQHVQQRSPQMDVGATQPEPAMQQCNTCTTQSADVQQPVRKQSARQQERKQKQQQQQQEQLQHPRLQQALLQEQQSQVHQQCQQLGLVATTPARVGLQQRETSKQQYAVVQQQQQQPARKQSARQQERKQKQQQQQQQQQGLQQEQFQDELQQQLLVKQQAQLQQQLQQLDEQQLQELMQQLSVEAARQIADMEMTAAAQAALTPLQQMLQACGQSIHLQDVPSITDFVSSVTDATEVTKLGEGTYGEAFKSGDVVFKLVPMEGANLINGWPQKGAADLLGEAIIAITLSGLAEQFDTAGNMYPSCTQAFVKTHRVGVCKGPYPQSFIKGWRAWDKQNKSENDAIEGLPSDQLYAVFAMANCGKDLEGYALQGYDQVRSMLLQVALALAVAEDSLAFEHRDLHWGNVMLTSTHPDNSYITARLRGSTIKVMTHGAAVCLIDFTASRLQTPGGDVVFCDLELEEGLFDGPKGKPQFETYRRMRKLTKKNWAASCPGTNVLWMLYLAELLLSSDKPVPGATAGQKRALRDFKKRLAVYSCCGEVIWDELFHGLLEVVNE